MKKWIILTLSVVTLGLSGCGSKDDGGGGGNGTNLSPWSGYGVCQPGQTYTQYGCLAQGFCPAGQGQYGNTCVPAIQPPAGTPGWGQPGQIGTQLVGQLQISDPLSFERLMKYGQACREYRGFYLGWNGFRRYNIKCRDFAYSGRIQVQISNPTDGAMAFVQLSGMNQYGQTIAMNIPMIYQAINGNQGFTLSDRGNMNFPSPRIRIVSTSGNIQSGQAQISITFDGYDFAYGTLGRYF